MGLATDVEDLRAAIGSTAGDPSLDPSERIAALRRLKDRVLTAMDAALGSNADDLEDLVGSCDSLTGSLELQREGAAMSRVLDKARMRENADLKARLPDTDLDADFYRSHGELDALTEDGGIEEASFGLASNFAEWKIRRGRGGMFANKPGEGFAIKGRAGKGGMSFKPPKPTQGARYKVPDKPPQSPQSPGVKEETDRIKAIPDLQQRLAEVQKYRLNDWPEKDDAASKVLGDAKDSQEAHTVAVAASPGTEGGQGARSYKAERKPIHDAIIGDALHGAISELLGQDHGISKKLRMGMTLSDSEKQQVRQAASDARDGGKPQALFMAGGPASGKTSALDAAPELRAPASVEINPDNIKDRLPDYRAMIEGGSKYAAMGVHEESSDLGKRLQAEAQDLGLNVVVDGTGDSKKGKFTGKMTDLNDAGYEVSALYTTIPTDEAVVRATMRAMKSGRWVPEPELRAQHKNVSVNFPDVGKLPFLSDLKVFDSTGATPTLIAQGGSGKVEPVHGDLFNSFLGKASE